MEQAVGRGPDQQAEVSAAGDLARAAELIAAWDYPAAHALLVQLHDAALAAGRQDQLDTLSVRRMLAEALREMGYLDEARGLASGVVRACRQRYGDRHPATVRALAGLGMVLHSAGEPQQARQCFEQAIASGVSAEQPAGRAVLLARAQLALVTRDDGDPAGAVRQLTAAYSLHRRAFGGKDLETIRLGAELGRLYSVLGDRPAARRQLAVAQAGAYAELGEDHPLTHAVEAALREVEAPMPSAVEPGFGETSTARWRRRRSAVEPGFGETGTAWWRRRRSAVEPGFGETGTAWWRRRDGPVSVPVERPDGRRRLRVLAAVAGGLGTLLVAAGAVAAVASGPGSSGPVPAAAAPARPGQPRSGPARSGPAGSDPGPADPARSDSARSDPAGPASRATTRPPAAGIQGAPRDVTLHDDGTSITVSWTDPTDGTGGVLLALNRAGQPAGPLRSLPAGTHEDRITGLDPGADYCVVLAVVYDQDAVAQAAQVCTHRGHPR